MISHKLKLIFIHIPKNGGTTIEAWMQSIDQRATFKRDLMQGLFFKIRGSNFAKAVNRYPSYRSFAFVRSPFSRFVSIWNHSNRPERNPKYWSRPPITSIEQYADCILSGNFDHLSAFDRMHITPQYEYLPVLDNSIFGRTVRAEVDYIGSLETFSSDFDALRTNLGLPLTCYKSMRISPNKTPLSSFYTQDLYLKVKKIYQKDCDMLIKLFPGLYDQEMSSWNEFCAVHAMK